MDEAFSAVGVAGFEDAPGISDEQRRNARLAASIAAHMRATPEPPRFRYFQKGGGPMCCWTTERDIESADSDDKGWFYSFQYRPVGKGARTGKAEQWEFVDSSLARHRKRKDAKARAERLYAKT